MQPSPGVLRDVHPQYHTPWATRGRGSLPTFRERRIFQVEAALGLHR